MARRRRGRRRREETLTNWAPRTSLGKEVQSGKTALEEIFQEGRIIKEPEIVDFLIPNLRTELILIGGTPGKGGGIRRTPTKRTTRMHRSGRRFKSSAMAVVGNGDGYVGIGQGWSKEHRKSIEKATNDAKLSVIPIRRGNGSWEDSGKEPNTIPFKITGKSGSVEVELIPAPRGTGLAASDTAKKILELAGIQDIWVKTRGTSKTRENVIKAIYNAFKNANSVRTRPNDVEKVGMIIGYSSGAPDISSQYVIEGMEEADSEAKEEQDVSEESNDQESTEEETKEESETKEEAESEEVSEEESDETEEAEDVSEEESEEDSEDETEKVDSEEDQEESEEEEIVDTEVENEEQDESEEVEESSENEDENKKDEE